MSEWKPIESAPKDGFVRLRSPSFAPDNTFYWHKRKRRWATKLITIMGFVDGWWDQDAEQPTEFSPTHL